jgi:electron transfer flavoprotein beta subunit
MAVAEALMKLLVCVKQVPDMNSRFKVRSDGGWFDESDLAFRINEYDEYAIEQAIKLKEQLKNEPELTVISIGPARADEAIKKSLAMGCDKGVHVLDDAYFDKDSWQIAAAIAAFAKDKSFDLIFTGMQSQDRGSGQVGVIVAELLGYNCATTLVGFEFSNGVVTAKRELEGGVNAIVRIKLPAVVTCQLGLNVPRYPTLPNIMKAKKKPVQIIPMADLLKEQKLIATDKIYAPQKKGSGVVLEGDVRQLASQLVGILKEKTAVVR